MTELSKIEELIQEADDVLEELPLEPEDLMELQAELPEQLLLGDDFGGLELFQEEESSYYDIPDDEQNMLLKRAKSALNVVSGESDDEISESDLIKMELKDKVYNFITEEPDMALKIFKVFLSQDKMEEEKEREVRIVLKESQFQDLVNYLIKQGENQRVGNLFFGVEDYVLDLILKEKDNAIAETEKNHQVKITELERRMRIEVAKISESILTPAPITVGKVDDKSEDNTFSKQKIVEIRKNGINEIAKIKLDYLSEIHKEKLNFNKIRLQHEHDSHITREEYNLKIEELKFNREKHQREMLKSADEYDFNTYMILNESKKDKLLEEKDMVNKYHLRIYQHKDTIGRIEVNNNLKNEKVANDLIEKVEQNDKKQIESFQELFKNRNDNFLLQTNHLLEFLEKIRIIFCETLEEIVIQFWNKYYEDEKIFINSLIMMSYESKKHEDFSYKHYINKIEQLNKSYYKMQDSRYKKLRKLLDSNFKDLENQIRSIGKIIFQYTREELQAANLYYAELNQLVNSAYLQNKSFYDAKFNNVTNKTNQKFLNEKSLREAEINALKVEIEGINNNYLAEDNNIALKKKNYDLKFQNQEKQMLENQNDIIKNIKKNISLIKKKNKVDYKTISNRLAYEFQKQVKAVEVERKTKLKIGQI